MEVSVLLTVLIGMQLFSWAHQAIHFQNLKSRIKKSRKKSLSIARKNEALLHHINLSLEKLTQSRSLPFLLCQIPFADDTGIILSVRTVELPSLSAPYNASIGPFENGYLLFFRYETPYFAHGPESFSSHIGCIALDRDFKPLEREFTKIETGSAFSEDARFFQCQGRHFLVYNDLAFSSTEHRCIHLGEIDLTTRRLKYTTLLPSYSAKIEKNWTPFSFQDQMYFLHTLNPGHILTLPDPQQNHFLGVYTSPFLEIDWTKSWGNLRGGTPALLVDGEYLAFFHSSFEDQKGVIWYIMGAYTFAATPPFKLTRLSQAPLLFKGIYDTPHSIIANPKIRALYPMGFTYEKRLGKEMFFVSCGENDSGIKIIEIDKQALFANLKKLD